MSESKDGSHHIYNYKLMELSKNSETSKKPLNLGRFFFILLDYEEMGKAEIKARLSDFMSVKRLVDH